MGDDKKSNNGLAKERTDLAEDRTVQATERTFAGWMRTAFAAIGIGLAFRAVFGDFDPPWLARAVATLFIILGGMIALSAQHRASKTFRRLSTHQVDAPDLPNLRWLSWSVALGALILIAGLWILNDGNLGDGQ
ncbi:YidH family protein [Altericroceibacterium endophyticum]|uniref:DUF202 domain-containing protein n=1 Tax=Altericroceibacterium endophyticum TaxID=1808508 RepID=A0A6I4T632_9SPHN|nr:DUF202 domain-containing protein [Altericroceibacterium endophyticum]MXO65463.1 DUF202 domain-containing protein [Altericroceibacterium endophyticum]